MSHQRRDSNHHLVAPPRVDKQRHSKFYFDSTLITIEIENTLFNVHKYQLMKSEVFVDMFETAQRDPGEGSSADKPIILEGISVVDFESLLTVLYTPRFSDDQPALNASLIIPAFRLASMWRFIGLRAHLLPLAEKELDDIDKIVFAREFDIPEWLVSAHTNLCQRTEPLRSEEAEKLGVQSVLLIYRAREEGLGGSRPATCFHCFNSDPSRKPVPYRAVNTQCYGCKQSPSRAWLYQSASPDESSVKSRVESWMNDGCVFSA